MTPGITKGIAKNFSWLLLGNLISGGINFAAVIFLARVLGVAKFGLLYFAQAFLFYLLVFLDNGLAVFGTREIARDRDRAGVITLNLLLLRLIVALVIYICALTIIWLVPASLEIRLLFSYTFLYVFYRALNADWVFQGLERMEFISFSKVIISTFTFLFIYILIKTPGDLVVVPLVNFCFGLLGSLVLLALLFGKLFLIKPSNLFPKIWWKYFISSVPLTASGVMILIYNNLDAIMLGFMAPPQVVGYYGSAYKILAVFSGAFTVWTTAVFPVSTRKIQGSKLAGRQFLEKYLRLTALVLFPVIFCVFLLAPLIISLVFGKEYLTAGLALQIIIWSLLLIGVASAYGSLLLIPAGYFGRFFMIVMTGAALNIILNLALIPPYGFVGAAVATLITEAIVLLLVVFYSRKILVLPLFKNIAGPLAFSSFAGLGIYIFSKIILFKNIYLNSITNTCIFAAVYVLLVILFERAFVIEFIREILRKT